ncbi:unnamed protein product [Rhizopus stolonifer]
MYVLSVFGYDITYAIYFYDSSFSFQTPLKNEIDRKIKVIKSTDQYNLEKPPIPSESLYKPNLRKTHLETLKKPFYFGTNPLTVNDCQTSIKEQRINKPIQSLN